MLCPVQPSGLTPGWTRPTRHITEPSAGPGPALEGLSPRRPFSSFRGVLLGQRSGLTGRGRGGLWASQPRRGQGPCRAWPAMGGHAARNREQTAELALRAWPWLQSAHQRPWSSPGGLDACSHGTHVADGGPVSTGTHRPVSLLPTWSGSPSGTHLPGSRSRLAGDNPQAQRREDQHVPAASLPAAAPVRAELCSRRRGAELRPPHVHGAALTPRVAVAETRGR